jgi:GT2 family glycosyltransferase
MNPTQENNSRDTKRVGIVILNYNGKSVLPGLLESLTKIDYPDFRIFLVDNNSADDSIEKARSEFSNKLPLEIIINSENLLFSAGNNVGIKKAIEWGADYVILLNNDTIVPQSMIKELAEFMEGHPEAGVAGPMIHFAEPQNTIWGAGGMVNLWWGLVRHSGIRALDTGQFSNPAIVDYVSGAALMASADVFTKLKMLDESFPMYYEDTDFCFRAKKAGYEIWYVPTAPLIHLVSVAAGGQASRFKITRRFSAGMKFFARHAQWYQWPTILIGQIYEAIRVGIMLLTGGQGKN